MLIQRKRVLDVALEWSDVAADEEHLAGGRY